MGFECNFYVVKDVSSFDDTFDNTRVDRNVGAFKKVRDV